MGNYHRRSKGCRTCVKRRVKCDQRHPKCVRCESARLCCEGFNEAVFVDAKEQVMKRFACPPKASSTLSSSAISGTNPLSCQLGDAMSVMTSVVQCCQVPPLTQHTDRVRPSPSTSCFRDEMYVSYTIKHLCKRSMSMMYSNVLPSNPSGLHPQRSMMNHCLLAMAKVFYGIQHREKRILQDGMCLYGRGLSTLSNVLSKANCIVTTEMVVSVLSLCVGESIMPSSNSSWTVHILGLERLFALRGPSFAVEGTVLDLVMLETCRPVMILGAFFTRKPSVMGQPEWKALAKPQESDRTTHLFQSSTKEDDMSFLMEILAEIPALFQLCDNCIQTAEPRQPSSATIGMIWSRAKQLQQELHAWKEKWHSVHLSEVYETLSTTAVNLYQSTAWTTIFYFSSVEVANTFIMYHPVVSLLTSIPTSLLKAGLGLQCSGPTSCISAEQSLPDVKVSVQNICRSIEYYLHFLQASQAPPDFFLFFPLHVARRTAKQLGYSSELAWLDDVYEVARLQFPLGICANKDFGDRFNGSGEGLFG